MPDNKISPTIGRNVYIAPSSIVCGDVTIGDATTIMYQVLIRGDVAPIRIGARCNIQDGTVVHTKTGVPLDIADDVAVGHRAVVHCRRIGSRTLIGIGAIVLDDCEIGENCVIGAGAVVPPGMIIPSGKVAFGVPAKIVRDATPRDIEYVAFVLNNYDRLAKEHAAGRFSVAATTADK